MSMQMKIEVWLVAPNKTESMNPSHFDMVIVKNPYFFIYFYFLHT